jgi:dTDP-4-amino-4,6-dideoxygalactose transaminase
MAFEAIVPHAATTGRDSMKRHAPAGRPIVSAIFERASRSPAVEWCDADARYFDSATSALAVAVREYQEAGTIVAKPRVLLPAYACPNLIAAVLFGGGIPEFVDFAPGGSTTSRASLQVDAGDIAVLVDFCGVPAHAGSLSGNATGQPAALIHDLAQSYLPFTNGWNPIASRTVVSFGRAKPVSLTQGGALLTRGVPFVRDPAAEDASRIRSRSRVYNISLNSIAFGVLSRLPFLGIGTTELRPVDTIRALDTSFEALATSAIQQYRLEQDAIYEGTARALQFVAEHDLQLPFDPEVLPANLPLWRVPVLLKSEEAADNFSRRAKRFGVSRLYRRTLPEFTQVSADEARTRWPNAWKLSRTLVTLPTHGRLGATEWERLASLL